MIERTILVRKSTPVPYKKRYAIVFFCMLSGLTCSLAYANLGAEFGGVSQNQSYGIIFSTAASVLLLVIGLLNCLYFARNDTTFMFPIKMLILMIIQVGLSLTGIVFLLLLPLPSKAEMKQFVITNETGKYSGALSRLQAELRCCGVDSYEDYKYSVKGVISWEVPSTCCGSGNENEKSNCEYPQRIAELPPVYTTGCLSEIADLRDLRTLAPKFYLLMNATRFLVLGLTATSAILIATLFSYAHVIFKRHKPYVNALTFSIPTISTSPASHGDCEFVSDTKSITSTSTSTTTAIGVSPSTALVEIADVKVNEGERKLEPDAETQMYLNMFKLDFAKMTELSLEQLPGSLSQLSKFIYGPASNFHPSNNLGTNKFV